MTVDIERQRVLSDEVIARHEFAGAEVGAAMEPRALVPVGNTGVEDGDDGALGAEPAILAKVLPGAQCIDSPRRLQRQRLRAGGAEAAAGEEIPLQRGPARAGSGSWRHRPRVVGNP